MTTGLSCACPVPSFAFSKRNGLYVCISCDKIVIGESSDEQPEIANMFRGGPLDGNAYTTEMLIGGEFDFFTNDGYILYHVTNELVTSEATGAQARVWEFRDSPFAPRKSNTTRKKDTMSETAPAADAAIENTVELENDLQDRRKALKLSRKQVSDQSGLSQAKVARIEGGGKRTSQDEIDQVAKALDELTPAESDEPAVEADEA